MSSGSAPSWILFALLAIATAPAYAGDGADLYAKHCASCHGELGDANTALGRAMKVPALNERGWTAEALGAALRESDKHKVVPSTVREGDLDALSAHMAMWEGAAP